jgi:hypothetical protein
MYLILLSYFNQIWIFVTDVIKVTNIKFLKNPCSGSQVGVWNGGRTVVINLTGTFHKMNLNYDINNFRIERDMWLVFLI